jgi:formate hydrogenlyase subunit 3/multisubunit Na+/H+ antiporter MnhD subunit
MIWFLIAIPWVRLMKDGYGRFASLLLAMFLSRLALGIFCPLAGIMAKWLIIGRCVNTQSINNWGARFILVGILTLFAFFLTDSTGIVPGNILYGAQCI